MRTIVVVLSTWLVLLGAWANPLPKKLAHALQQREHFYYNRHIVFIVETQYDIFKPRRNQAQSRYILEIFRSKGAIMATQRPLQGTKYRTELGNDIYVELDKGTNGIIMTSSCYLGEEVGALVEPDMEFQSQSPAKVGMGAVIGRNATQGPYGNPQVPSFVCQEVCNQRGVFTVGLDVSKLYGAQWERIEERGNRWIMIGRINAPDYDSAATENEPDVVIRVELSKSDALVLELEIFRPLRAANNWQRGRFRTVRTHEVDGFNVPAEIEYRAESSGGGYVVRSHYKLVSIKPFKNVLSLEIPLGTRVEDRRLGRPVSYRWQGRLPTEEELKQLALHQGYLLPAESPQRRYSLWLFVPAVVFFAVAGYLYWRQRRK